MVPNVFFPEVALAAHEGISPRDAQDWRAGSGNGPRPPPLPPLSPLSPLSDP